MKFDISSIEQAINKAFEFSGKEVQISDSVAQNKESIFTSTLCSMVKIYDTPDYPCYIDCNELPKKLGFKESLIAIWDFDYYFLSLRQKNGKTIIVKHEDIIGTLNDT